MGNVTLLLYVAVGAYAVFLGGFLYFFVFADPDESPTALFLTETLPQKSWAMLERYLPENVLEILSFFVSRFLSVFYLAVVLGAWSIIMFYLFPWVDSQSYVSPVHKYVAIFVFAACLSSWRLACTTSPGIITPKNVARYDHFPYDNVLFAPGGRCRTTGIPRIPRSKFDRHRYNANVPRFDHFCTWLYNTIGEENYRFFLLFLFVHVGACSYGTNVVGSLFYGHVLENDMFDAVFVNRHSGEEVPVTKFVLFQYLFDRFLLPSAVLLLMAVMAVAIGLLFVYHVWLTSRGMTTNEKRRKKR